MVVDSPPGSAADTPLSQVPAKPQRPTKSRSAAPAPEGTVQLETGVALDDNALGTDLGPRVSIYETDGTLLARVGRERDQ